jgi:hypothetical protein
MKRFSIAILLVMVLLSGCAPAAEPTPIPGALFVDPGYSLGEISPLVYGSNYGPWLVVSFDMLPRAYESGVTILRFPAGSWGDHNNVTKLQIDQFMDFANKVGATAMFNVRSAGRHARTSRRNGPVYTNVEKKYNVQYWGIGNEPTLYESEVRKIRRDL